MNEVDANKARADQDRDAVGRLARLETDMEWVKRMLWFVIALIIGIYLDLPSVVQGVLP